MSGGSGWAGRGWASPAVVAMVGMMAACTMNRPATGDTRPGPESTTVSMAPRDTLFARALAALRTQGFTEVTPDPGAGQLRAKSRDGMQIRVTLSPAGNATQVRITTEGGPRGPGIDSQAMATVLALASAISAPNGAGRDSTVASPASTPP